MTQYAGGAQGEINRLARLVGGLDVTKDADMCQWSRCRQWGDAGTYYDRALCEKHWDALWNIERADDRKKKMGVTLAEDRRQGPTEDWYASLDELDRGDPDPEGYGDRDTLGPVAEADGNHDGRTPAPSGDRGSQDS